MGTSGMNSVLAQNHHSANMDEYITVPVYRRAHHPHPLDLCASPDQTPHLTSSGFLNPPTLHSSQHSFHFLILTETWLYSEGTASSGSSRGSYFSYTLPTNRPRAKVASLILISFQITDPLSCLQALSSQSYQPKFLLITVICQPPNIPFIPQRCQYRAHWHLITYFSLNFW